MSLLRLTAAYFLCRTLRHLEEDPLRDGITPWLGKAMGKAMDDLRDAYEKMGIPIPKPLPDPVIKAKRIMGKHSRKG